MVGLEEGAHEVKKVKSKVVHLYEHLQETCSINLCAGCHISFFGSTLRYTIFKNQKKHQDKEQLGRTLLSHEANFVDLHRECTEELHTLEKQRVPQRAYLFPIQGYSGPTFVPNIRPI